MWIEGINGWANMDVCKNLKTVMTFDGGNKQTVDVYADDIILMHSVDRWIATQVMDDIIREVSGKDKMPCYVTDDLLTRDKIVADITGYERSHGAKNNA